MELSKCRKFLNNDNYIHCSICGNYRNMKSFAHRKSKDHQKKLSSKLSKIAFHLSKKKKKQAIIHDEEWPGKDSKRFCHFCAQNYEEHFQDGEFLVEDLGALYHHANSFHVKSVDAFINRNFSKENPAKYCIHKADLDSFLKKVSEAKARYLQKMCILNDMTVKQIMSSEEQRKKLVSDELQAQSSSKCLGEQNILCNKVINRETVKSIPKLNSQKNKSEFKVPPWLEDDSVVESSDITSTPVIGPTIDTLMKHVENQKKKGLSQNRIGANFQHVIRASCRWRPSFHGTWNRKRRKEIQGKFKQKNKKK